MNQPAAADQKKQQQGQPEQPRSRYEQHQDFVAQQHADAVRTSQRSDQQVRLDNAGWHTSEQQEQEQQEQKQEQKQEREA